jgi:Fur family transcriptional regulator, ferric uptake regulator
MTGNRLTKQRRLILEELKKVCTHPDAYEIYNIVKKKMPGIGLATVYRNLDFLNKQNKLIKVMSVDGKARFDGDITNHSHLICKKCGHIDDIFDIKNISIDSEQIRKSKFAISDKFLEIYGLCKKCQK